MSVATAEANGRDHRLVEIFFWLEKPKNKEIKIERVSLGAVYPAEFELVSSQLTSINGRFH